MAEGLKLRAEDADDITVVSAMLQDAVVDVTDMVYLRDEGRFALVASRFKWENCPEGRPCDRFERVHTGISFEGVQAVKRRGIEGARRAGALELLTIRVDDGAIDLLFAGDGAIRLEVGDWRCHVADMGEPWPTAWRPQHPEGED
jgi:hypothetical protein